MVKSSIALFARDVFSGSSGIKRVPCELDVTRALLIKDVLLSSCSIARFDLAERVLRRRQHSRLKCPEGILELRPCLWLQSCERMNDESLGQWKKSMTQYSNSNQHSSAGRAPRTFSRVSSSGSALNVAVPLNGKV